MAEDFLEEIYGEAILYTELKETMEWARGDITNIVLNRLKELLPKLGRLSKKITQQNPERGLAFWEKVEKLTEYTGGNAALADYIEDAVLPVLDAYLRSLNEIDVDDGEGFCLRSSRRGFLTLYDTERNFYLHSALDPMWEAREQIRQLYDPSAERYAILGCGLGYHAYQLYRISEGSVRIYLFEREQRIVDYALNYGVLSWIPQECLEITVDENILPFFECAEQENTEHFVFRPEMDRLPENVLPPVRGVYIQQCTRWSYELLTRINFFRNTLEKAGGKNIRELYEKEKSENFAVIAGGPSLEQNLELLRSLKGKVTLIAVGTVFGKLLRDGVEPDYVTVMDPQHYTLKQLADVENCKVPLILSATAYWAWMAKYAGDKYIVPVTGCLKEVEDYAVRNHLKIWPVGGSVTSLATRAALEFGAKRIYLFGADFAYPGGDSHAPGTPDYKKMDSGGLFPVESVDGKEVYTEANMNGYRKDMEKVIADNPSVRFYNMSTVGAKIHGAGERKNAAF